MVIENQVSEKSKILFVDDGSMDNTWKLIYKESIKGGFVRGIKLSRNVGYQNALFAAKSSSDCVVSIDADLQDDIKVIRKFIEK